ncbi:hypothetical protein CBR_g34085 [Chara braunii]|uniref:Uncharacterized protein n=1 Tax=Chara braunii TaxID=69332 RepID=A0A388LI55_CHABU|nr:hypothetical protein CBR_g34085 [Chara braunii]|eukprot:GBG81902.1 hypothetical protein CBR_g34085 [Chara braunii]
MMGGSRSWDWELGWRRGRGLGGSRGRDGSGPERVGLGIGRESKSGWEGVEVGIGKELKEIEMGSIGVGRETRSGWGVVDVGIGSWDGDEVGDWEGVEDVMGQDRREPGSGLGGSQNRDGRESKLGLGRSRGRDGCGKELKEIEMGSIGVGRETRPGWEVVKVGIGSWDWEGDKVGDWEGVEVVVDQDRREARLGGRRNRDGGRSKLGLGGESRTKWGRGGSRRIGVKIRMG